MANWNSIPLEITYEVLGWTAFISWSISFYPQVILNFRRKSVVGLNFDFVVLNLTKHSSYLIYNAALYFSSAIQKQYFEKYGQDQMIPVAANDVAFSIHAVLLTAITLFQIAIYERGSQKVSKITIGIVSAVWLFAAVCIFLALPSHSWLWLISIFNLGIAKACVLEDLRNSRRFSSLCSDKKAFLADQLSWWGTNYWNFGIMPWLNVGNLDKGLLFT